jgi:hypothetical protein
MGSERIGAQAAEEDRRIDLRVLREVGEIALDDGLARQLGALRLVHVLPRLAGNGTIEGDDHLDRVRLGRRRIGDENAETPFLIGHVLEGRHRCPHAEKL